MSVSRVRLWTSALWEYLRTGYWPVPGMMALAGLVAAVVMVNADELLVGERLWGLGWFYEVDPPGARAILSTVAASAITVAGVVFSITIVALSMASAQYGPRLLPNFMRQGTTKVVLGTFIGTFIYCLLVLSSVQGQQDRVFVPYLSVVVGLGLGIVSFGVLIYFIHDVSRFIQAPHVIDDVATELVETLGRLFPERPPAEDGDTPDEENKELLEGLEERARTIPSRRTGYVQALDTDGLVELSLEHDLLVRVLSRPGQFVVKGHALCLAAPREAVDEATADGISGLFLIGPTRTPVQDVEFAVDQLVEVALRALSPGVNDPFTAINCLDRLGGALSFLGDRALPSAYHRDRDGRVLVATEPYTYAGVVDAAFNQIRQHARTNLAVTIRLLEIIHVVAQKELPHPYREALARQAKLVYEGARQAAVADWDRNDLDGRYRILCETLGLDRPDGGTE